MNRCFIKRRLRKFILFITLAFIIWLSFNFIFGNYDTNVEIIFESCPIPNFINPSIDSKILSSHENLDCPKNLKFVKVNKGVVLVENGLKCSYQCIEWVNDFNSIVKEHFILLNGSKLPCPYFISSCSHSDSEELYFDIILGVDHNPKLLDQAICKAAFDNINDILIIGVGSLSYNTWEKMLPKTFSTFHNKLDGISFKKFNTLGDGPTANLQALLTGTKDTEVYESRKRILLNDHIDGYNWIWKHLHRKGYLTSFTDELAKFGVFQYRLRGFKAPPTDYYLRTAFLIAERNKMIKGLCLPSNSLHKEILNFYDQFHDMYTVVPKFSFMYFRRYSVKQSVRYMDNDLSKFIVDAKEKNPNLFLILYSDDGNYMERKHSMVEKYEERLPFMGISLPNNMENKRNTLEANSKILTSSFDLHATLEDIIGIYKPMEKTRHMSLLRPLPENRACKDIDVALHWCSCFNWKTLSIPLKDSNVAHLAEEAVSILSAKTILLRNLCEPLILDHIIEVHYLEPTSEVLKFRKSIDPDGFIPDFSDNTTQEIFWYKMKIMVQPENVIYTISFSASLRNHGTLSNISILSFPPENVVKENKNPNLVKCLQIEIQQDNIKLQEIQDFCICKNANNYFL